MVDNNLIDVRWCGPHIQKEIVISWKEYRGKQLNLKSNDPYDIRLNKLNLMSLQKRRLLTDAGA